MLTPSFSSMPGILWVPDRPEPGRRNSNALWWERGDITVKYPSDPLIAKMVRLTERFGAKVQGDDGEIYREDRIFLQDDEAGWDEDGRDDIPAAPESRKGSAEPSVGPTRRLGRLNGRKPNRRDPRPEKTAGPEGPAKSNREVEDDGPGGGVGFETGANRRA